MQNNFKLMIEKQRNFFANNATLPLCFRIEQLKKLKCILQIHEPEIASALKKDLNKAPLEAILNEIILVKKEIDYVIKHLKKWLRPKKVATPFPALWPGKSAVHMQPYGLVLIIAPWNYPFMLVMSPLIGAISAGNCVMIKPSEMAIHTQELILKLISEYFSPDYITAITATPSDMTQLLQEKFDYIFFTGSPQVGKIIMDAAAKQLTPVTLELGGKSPCIVDETADLDFAARRIIWAKTSNAGQICIAPDYLYVQRSCKEKLIKKLEATIKNFYGDDPEKSASFGRIINQKHFERLRELLQHGTIISGGKLNAADLYISPTLIDDISWEHPIMQEEIFGPILPIITFNDIDEVIQAIKLQPKSLALYLFTKNKITETKILTQLSFGGGCINDCLMHLANLNLPFGGIGQSGMGYYRGKHSFETFSHRKSIYKKSILVDYKLEYPPYNNKKLWIIRQLFKI